MLFKGGDLSISLNWNFAPALGNSGGVVLGRAKLALSLQHARPQAQQELRPHNEIAIAGQDLGPISFAIGANGNV